MHVYDPVCGKPIDLVDTVDMDGNPVGQGTVLAVRERDDQHKRRLLLLEVFHVFGFQVVPRHQKGRRARPDPELPRDDAQGEPRGLSDSGVQKHQDRMDDGTDV